MSDVAIVGLGIHPFGRHPGVSGLEMAAVAARRALGGRGRRLGGDRLRGRRVGRRRQRRHVGRRARAHRPAVHQRQERLRDRRHGAHDGARDARSPALPSSRSWSASTSTPGRVQPAPRGLGPRLLVRRDRADADHAVLRHEDPALHGRARDQAVHAREGRGKAFATARSTQRVAAHAALREDVLESRDGEPPLTQYMFCSPGEGAVALVLARGASASSSLASRCSCAPSRFVRVASDRSRSSARRFRSSRAVADGRRGRGGLRAGRASGPGTSMSPRCRTPSRARRSCTSPRPASASTASRRR